MSGFKSLCIPSSCFDSEHVSQESFRGVEAAGAALLLLSLVLVAAQTGGNDSISAEGGREATANTITETGGRDEEGTGKVA